MAIQVSQSRLFPLVLVLINLLTNIGDITASHDSNSISRSSFPAGFIFGTASAAYQYEGAAKEGGKGPNNWDTYTHDHPDAISFLWEFFTSQSEKVYGIVAERIKDRSNGDVAIDSYHRYKEDVNIMKEMGLDAYRFSISWARVLPHGKLSGGVNKEGIQYYNNLIKELLSKGIKPFVTLFHWDVPQALEDKYGGFLSPDIVDDFKDYVELCFQEFGDRVKHWITLNEPHSMASLGYGDGSLAPGRCSKWVADCTGGDSATEPYLVGHNQLLAHAAAVKLYREKYQASQKGKIGITLNSHWMVPLSKQKSDVAAAQRALDFMYGWYLSPLTYGYYPKSMQSQLKQRLPKFSEEQVKMVKGSMDFVGVNYYTAYYATDDNECKKEATSTYSTDSCAKLLQERKGVPIGPESGSSWLRVYPKGIWKLLNYTKNEYKDPLIYITENGISEANNSTLTREEALADKWRIDYYSGHLKFINKAIKESGVNVKGFFAWSLFDNFEWSVGYTVRFGINFVDYNDGLKRYPKHSANWFKKFLHSSKTSKTRDL